MHTHFLKVSFLVLTIFSMSVSAGLINKQFVPNQVFDYIYKKHPKATNITVEEKKHFGQALYEVKFTAATYNKNNQAHQEEMNKLFKLNGHFYTNAIIVDSHAFNVISDEATKKLKLYDPDYEIMALKLVSNPNGVGEEYEINLLSHGKIVNISIDNHGNIISETRLE